MWFGTRYGLNKYDGYKFTVYLHDPADSTSIGSNSIETLFEDRTGVLWIGTNQGGLNKFNREKENFTRYIFNNNGPNQLQSNSISQIAGFQYKGKNVLWIGTQNGLYKMDMTSQKFKHYLPSNKDFPYNYIEAMVVDSSGMLWLGCTEGGLYKFNPETEQFTNFLHDPNNPNSLNDNRVTSLFLDKSGILWIGTFYRGLSRFDPKKEQFIHFQPDPDKPGSISDEFVHSFFEDQNAVLWISTAGGGLNRFDREKEEFTHYQHKPGDPTSLCDNTVLCVYKDRSSVLWIGTFGGINKIDPRKKQISYFKQMPGNPNSLMDIYIWSICESNWDDNINLWIGIKTGGLSKLDRRMGKYTHYQYNPKKSSGLPSNHILSLYEDRSGILWIGTYGDGLIKFNQKTEAYTQYMNDRNNPKTISCDIINSIFEDSKGNLWIATRTGGLNKLDRNTDNFSQIGIRMHTLYVYEDKSGIIWLATLQGLKKYDPETEKFHTYINDPENPNSINTDQVNYIYESDQDDSDVLWIGTSGGGLNKFERNTEIFTHFTVDDGLPDNVINGILEDDHGNLWLSTNKGLSRFNSVTQKFRNYDVNDGLLSNQFNLGVCSKSFNGEMLFGSTKGLIAFHPDSLLDNIHIPEIVITEFQLFNENVEIEKLNSIENDEFYKLTAAISQLKEIELSYKENIFSFEFAALDYRSPQKNQYAYKMEGVDPDWVYTDASRRFATYTHLDPGEYTFTVRGSNNDGVWKEEGTSIKIVINPPWWRTNLAYMLYVFLAGFIVFGIWRFQSNRLKMIHQLEIKHLHAEKLEEVDRMKSRFFANISHEFRTPLTLIKGPVKQMLQGEFIGNVKDQYKMILRNSDRLLGLINQILDLSKLESDEIKLQVAETDIIHYLRGIVLSFSPLAESKKVTLKFNFTENSLTGYIDLDKLEKIVNNLLSNAFKFTPENGEVAVYVIPTKVGIQKSKRILYPRQKAGRQVRDDIHSHLQFTVSNTGDGIPSDHINKIFDRFYQADDNYIKDGESSGIGLALTKELVEVYHGEIAVSSIPDKTTTFVVTLPIARECFKEDEIKETTETGGRRQETENSEISINQTPAFLTDRDLRSAPTDLQSPFSDVPPEAPGLRSPLIILVEDNPDVTSYISSFMKNDYNIITAEDGRIGLKNTLDKYPDLVISDVMMPEMDGFELCQKIKSDERISHIPVILLTAKADLDSKIDGLEFGADDYVTKPFEARELQIRSKTLIEQRRKLREKFSLLVDLRPEDIATSSMDEQLLQHLLAVFEDHMEESDFTLEHLAKEIGMSRTHLNRKIQALTNLSTRDFIRTLRLQQAARLLSNTSGTISEIAYKVGFNNLSYFSRVFRKHFGRLPSEYPPKR
jgi:signal transduction histidine kinase/ligand-binding sensor domain-containing protein/DNA-binding response OmpR family regulator